MIASPNWVQLAQHPHLGCQTIFLLSCSLPRLPPMGSAGADCGGGPSRFSTVATTGSTGVCQRVSVSAGDRVEQLERATNLKDSAFCTESTTTAIDKDMLYVIYCHWNNPAGFSPFEDCQGVPIACSASSVVKHWVSGLPRNLEWLQPCRKPEGAKPRI